MAAACLKSWLKRRYWLFLLNAFYSRHFFAAYIFCRTYYYFAFEEFGKMIYVAKAAFFSYFSDWKRSAVQIVYCAGKSYIQNIFMQRHTCAKFYKTAYIIRMESEFAADICVCYGLWIIFVNKIQYFVNRHCFRKNRMRFYHSCFVNYTSDNILLIFVS